MKLSKGDPDIIIYEPLAVLRNGAAPGFVALVEDLLLREHYICVEIGHVTSIDKIHVAQNAIQERSMNHSHSECAKPPMKSTAASCNIRLGDLV